MIAVYPAISLNMIAASSRVGLALGVPLESDILGSPLYSMPRYHGARKAEHLGPSGAPFKKGCAVFVAMQRLYRCARPNLRGSSSICRQPSPSDQRLERKKGFR